MGIVRYYIADLARLLAFLTCSYSIKFIRVKLLIKYKKFKKIDCLNCVSDFNCNQITMYQPYQEVGCINNDKNIPWAGVIEFHIATNHIYLLSLLFRLIMSITRIIFSQHSKALQFFAGCQNVNKCVFSLLLHSQKF